MQQIDVSHFPHTLPPCAVTGCGHQPAICPRSRYKWRDVGSPIGGLAAARLAPGAGWVTTMGDTFSMHAFRLLHAYRLIDFSLRETRGAIEYLIAANTTHTGWG